ncbi:hypothetical protein CWC46_15990 [Prodigiosinella confusarubida]|uniref:Inner membrane protein YbjM n=1 Tax=Serratia sp. (strain ATCC 39006) TaxID=104623 RepID=A0A2I5T9D8_SERS3|nr:inner membrane protein YbjM [Serratia sp. ATCC 39006]AUH01181.1 hypothetical protein CWC46_15990 [Serratia sp. ATCC 39006]AUH05502.1 hypothetical protein Ser39006_015995 [Serratia sp. ATCC 39006]
MAGNRGWVGVVSCFILFTLIFLSQKMVVSSVAGEALHGDPGMLLFLLPGVVSSCLAGGRRLRYTFIGSLIASLICLLILHLWIGSVISFWQELAYVAGALFWSLMGGLMLLFLHAASRRYFR